MPSNKLALHEIKCNYERRQRKAEGKAEKAEWRSRVNASGSGEDSGF